MTDAELPERRKPRRRARNPATPGGQGLSDPPAPAEDAPTLPPTGEAPPDARPEDATASKAAETPAAGAAEAPTDAGPGVAASGQRANGGADGVDRRPARRRRRWRSTAVVVLLLIASVLTPLSIAGLWLRNQIFDESTYVDTVAPLSSDPAVQNAVANYVTLQIFSRVDVQAQVQRILPPALEPLSAPIASQVQSFTAGKVHDVVISDQFSVLWTQMNRLAHQQVINFLLGRPGGVGVSGGKLVINIRPVLDLVVQKLQASGVSFVSSLPLDKVNTNFVIADSSGLAKYKDQLRLLQGVTTVLPFVTLALFAGAIALARDRRRALLMSALGAAAGCLVLGVALSLSRGLYLDSVTGPNLPQDAAGVMFDTIVRFLRDANRAVFALALVIVAATLLTGPSRSAVRARASSRQALDWFSRRTTAPGRERSVGAWASEHRNLLRGGVVTMAALVLLFWDRPTGLVVLVIALLTLVAIGVVEIVAAWGREVHAPPAVTP